MRYGECGKNTVEAHRMYSEKFPNIRVPAAIYFGKLKMKFIKEIKNNNEKSIISDEKFLISEDAEINVFRYLKYKSE